MSLGVIDGFDYAQKSLQSVSQDQHNVGYPLLRYTDPPPISMPLIAC